MEEVRETKQKQRIRRSICGVHVFVDSYCFHEQFSLNIVHARKFKNKYSSILPPQTLPQLYLPFSYYFSVDIIPQTRQDTQYLQHSLRLGSTITNGNSP